MGGAVRMRRRVEAVGHHHARRCEREQRPVSERKRA